MKELYRGHEIVVLEGNPRSIVVVDPNTGVYLPTKVTALPNEGEPSWMRRARQLIDIYLDAQTRQ